LSSAITPGRTVVDDLAQLFVGPYAGARYPARQAPVAQWIERSPPEREVAGSNPAGRIFATSRGTDVRHANQHTVADEQEKPPESVLLAYYASARTELVQRIQQRDQALVLFAAVIGVAVTAVFSEFGSDVMLFAIPYIGLGATFVSTQHDALVNALGRYCADELGKHLLRVTPVRQWDNSISLYRTTHIALGHRLYAHLLLLVAPQIAAVVGGVIGLIDEASPTLVIVSAAIAGALPVGYSAYLIRDSYQFRRNW
jgi:hypothetical protein